MTPKTQSVCELCKAGIARNGKAHFRDGEFIGWCKRLCEPVAEPASTGEQPRKLSGMEDYCDDCPDNGSCLALGICRATVPDPAARPSEPSAPHKSAIEIAGERDLKVITEPIDWEAVENDAALQTSAELGQPFAKKYMREKEEAESLREPVSGDTPDAWRKLPAGHWFFLDSPTCSNRYSVQERTDSGCTLVCSTPWHHDGAKTDMQRIADLHNSQVSAPAPSPTPSVSTEPQWTVVDDGSGQYSFPRPETAAAPSVAGTQPSVTQGLIGLNEQQMEICRQWSKNSPSGMWGNDEAREFNLRTFSRAILGAKEKPCLSEPTWPALDPDNGDFTDGWNQAIDLCKQAFEKWRGAAQGTPQVEEISREIAEKLAAMHLIVWQGLGQAMDEYAKETAAILRKHGVGAPAQPGTEEKK